MVFFANFLVTFRKKAVTPRKKQKNTPPFGKTGGFLCHLTVQRLTAQNVEMQVMHRLTGICATVGNHTIAARQLLGSGNLRNDLKDVGNHSGVVRSDAIAVGDMGLGNHQHVGGCLGSDVPEGVDSLILVNLGGRNVAGDDFAE